MATVSGLVARYVTTTVMLTRAEQTLHFDQTRHVRYEDVGGGFMVCVECREIAQGATQAAVARDWTGEV